MLRKHLFLTLVLAINCHFMWKMCVAIVSIQEYCDAFPDNLRPVICIIKEKKTVAFPVGSTTTSRSTRATTHDYGWGWTESWGPPQGHEGWHESSESEESPGCSCDVSCIPPLGGNETDNLLCKQCGNNCDVKTSIVPKCNCAAVGTGLLRRGKKMDFDINYIDPGHRIGQSRQLTSPTCNCTVTCAHKQQERMGRWEEDEDDIPFCIFNITGLNSTIFTPVTCECCKSKASIHNRFPDFVCICQRS